MITDKDIEKLKAVFTTKQDLHEMEERIEARIITLLDDRIEKVEKRFNHKLRTLENRITKKLNLIIDSFDSEMSSFNRKIERIETHVGI